MTGSQHIHTFFPVHWRRARITPFMNSERFRFGLFEFDPATRELRREGARVHLAAQPAQALHLLLVHAGRLVTREELRQGIWGSETHVNFERGLNFCIGQIRMALDDDATSPRYVRTAAKRGYEFIAPIEKMAGATTARAPFANLEGHPGTPQKTLRSGRAIKLAWSLAAFAVGLAALAGAWWLHKRVPIVAVYRFDNETSDPAMAQFSDALTDNLVVELTRSSGGHYVVVGNAQLLRSPRDQRDLSSATKELSASYAVLGQVQTAAGKTRVLAHLIRLPEQTHLWVVREDYALSNPLDVESDAASRIGSQFGQRLAQDSSGHRLPPLQSR